MKRKLPPTSSGFIERLKAELKESSEQQPCELLHLLTPQILPPSGSCLTPSNTGYDSMTAHFEYLQFMSLPPQTESGSCHLPYAKRLLYENVPGKVFKEMSRKFVVDDRLATRSTLEFIGLTKDFDKYEKNQGIPIGDKSFNKYLSIDLLTVLESYVDAMIEYGNTIQPEQFERTCVFHMLNHILKREKIISENNEVFDQLEGNEKKKGLDLKDFAEESDSDIKDADMKEIPNKESEDIVLLKENDDKAIEAIQQETKLDKEQVLNADNIIDNEMQQKNEKDQAKEEKNNTNEKACDTLNNAAVINEQTEVTNTLNIPQVISNEEDKQLIATSENKVDEAANQPLSEIEETKQVIETIKEPEVQDIKNAQHIDESKELINEPEVHKGDKEPVGKDVAYIEDQSKDKEEQEVIEVQKEQLIETVSTQQIQEKTEKVQIAAVEESKQDEEIKVVTKKAITTEVKNNTKEDKEVKIASEPNNDEHKELSSEQEDEAMDDVDDVSETYEMITRLSESKKYKEHKKALNETTNKETKYELLKDQGFTQAKVLILCPFKKQAFNVVNELVMQFKQKWKGTAHKKKFKDEYGAPEEASNDCFKLGISFYGKTIKLYASFNKADIIVASPLGLKTMAQEGEGTNYDFLSSIELTFLLHAHMFLYQNLEHLEEILKQLNKLPTKMEGLTNINRIMDLYLDKKGELLRQTVVLTKYKALELNYLLKVCGTNYMGRFYLPYEYQCLFSKELIAQGKKIYLRKIPVGDIESVHEKKFDFFTKKIWSKLYESLKMYTILYVPSYFDFVRLRKYFKETETSIGYISEYTNKKTCQSQRALFETKRFRFLMYTERAHFFELIKLRFARHLVFYGIPEDASFIQQMIDLLDPEKEALVDKVAETQKARIDTQPIEEEPDTTQWDVHIYYTKHDEYQLERVVGTAHVKRYITTETNTSLI